MKKGLVLEGGGMRGLFTAGFLDVLMENGIEFDGAVGVSAGATFGCNYKSRQIGRVLRYNLRFLHDPRYVGLYPLLREGNVVSNKFSYHTLPNELDVFDREEYVRNPMEFHVVATDVHTGQAEYKKLERMDDNDLEWIRASSYMPGVSHPVPIDGHMYLDGAVADSIPLKYFQQQGYERNIVVLTQPKGFRKKLSRFIPVMDFLLRRYPVLAKTFRRRPEMYNGQLDYIDEQERLGNALLVYPDKPFRIGRIDHRAHLVRETYEIGRQKALDMLPQIKEFLSEV